MAWRTAESLKQLRSQVDLMAPRRRVANDGTIGDAAHAERDSDHNPWVMDGSVGVVTAIDITHDPASGCDAGLIVEALVASRDSRIKYLIWNRQLLSATIQPWVWRPYSGDNPHTAHFHLSVRPEKQFFDATGPWRIHS